MEVAHSHTGTDLTFWCGGYAQDRVAVLVCCALSNYHSTTFYKWLQDDIHIGNPFAVLYTEKKQCVIENPLGGLKMQKFNVIGKKHKPGCYCRPGSFISYK